MIGVPKNLSCFGKTKQKLLRNTLFLIFVLCSATAQWFANVENLQKEAVDSLKKVRMVPEVCKYIYIHTSNNL